MKNHKLKTVLFGFLFFILIEILTIPYFSIARVKTENPVETALMRQRIREAEDEGKALSIKQRWIPLARIPKHVVDAVIVAEDGTFYTHGGIDWFEVQQSLEKNLDKRRTVRGASTITQQLAKNLYLSTSKDPVRKFREVLITMLLEHELSKNRILEIYLNVIEWGRGIFGIEAAAQTYFGKSASGLTLEEATRLAAVIPSPLRHRPDVDSRYVMRRKQIVLRRMSARNFTDQTLSEENPSSNQLNRQPQPADVVDTLDTATDADSTDIDEEGSNGL
jgi:monofunctional biosynthetic peptidoglycan transglycosylase